MTSQNIQMMKMIPKLNSRRKKLSWRRTIGKRRRRSVLQTKISQGLYRSKNLSPHLIGKCYYIHNLFHSCSNKYIISIALQFLDSKVKNMSKELLKYKRNLRTMYWTLNHYFKTNSLVNIQQSIIRKEWSNWWFKT